MVDDVVKLRLKGAQKHSRRGRTYRRRQRSRRHPERPCILIDKQYIALLKWAKKNGVMFSSLQPAVFKNTGRGMMSTKRISQSDEIISVPKRLLITPSTAIESTVGTVCQKLLKVPNIKLTNKCLLCVYLIFLKYLGKKTFWYPYIATLPQDFTTPSYFSKNELDLLPSSCYERSRDQIDRVKQAFMDVKTIIRRELQEFDLNFWKLFTYENFLWAWFVVNTRSVYLDSKETSGSFYGDGCHGDNYALAPVLDLLNHNDRAEVCADFHQCSQMYKIQTVTQYNEHEQVFINYGPHDNTTLLIEYGFILPNNVHNIFKLEPTKLYNLIGLKDTTKNISKNIDLIRKSDLEKDFSFSYNHGMSWSLQTALRILTLTHEELDQWTHVFDETPLSSDKEQLVHKWVFGLASSTLNAMKIQEGKAMTDGELSVNMHLILELRKQEKQIIERTLYKLEEQYILV